ncbi:MAG: chemotaxis protein MotB [Alteromonadaceae bacterium]|jgi:chemotaxis protein MotB
MSDEFDTDNDEKPAGLPGWMATFADMMALLMAFFVLLLSFSEIDAQKFKLIAGSMKQAFGLQNEIRLEDIPKGTSVIFDEFSPGKPDPTPMKQIEQTTRDSSEEFLDRSEQQRIDDELLEATRARQQQAQAKANQDRYDKLKMQLQGEIDQGALELENLGQQIIIRIHEKGAFGSASAFLQPRFKPTIMKIALLLNDMPGAISVAGHTDNQPINSDLFDNNWDLSAKRAVAVATQMTRVDSFDTSRMSVSGFASNQPLIDRDTRLARQRNRRVEVIITHGKATELKSLKLPDGKNTHEN